MISTKKLLTTKARVSKVVAAVPKYSCDNWPKKPNPKRAVPLRTTVSAKAATVSMLITPKPMMVNTPQSGPILASAIGKASRPEVAGKVRKKVSQKGGNPSNRVEKADQPQRNLSHGVTVGAKMVVSPRW